MKFRAIVTGFFLIVTPAAFAQAPAPAAPAEYSIKEHDTKYEYRIPMRDGKKLFTAVYLPKDQS